MTPLTEERIRMEQHKSVAAIRTEDGYLLLNDERGDKDDEEDTEDSA